MKETAAIIVFLQATYDRSQSLLSGSPKRKCPVLLKINIAVVSGKGVGKSLVTLLRPSHVAVLETGTVMDAEDTGPHPKAGMKKPVPS